MTRCHLSLFKQRSRYISWNILFLWGFGLWIALCTSDTYRSDILAEKAVLLYRQNLNFGIMHTISTKTDIMEDTLCVMATNSTLSNTALMLRPALEYIDIFAFVFLVILSVCMQERIRRKIEVWNNIFHRRRNSSSVISYLNSLVRKHKKDDIFKKEIYTVDHIVLQSEILINSEISVEQKTLQHEQMEDECAWVERKTKNILNTNITIVQNEIAFNGYTLLLFNSYELHRYFNNQQLKNTCNLLTKYSATRNLNDVKLLNENIDNLPLKKCLQKGIISSSPEFKKFLENLKRSRFFNPFMLEISTSYIICIKSIYK